MNEKQQAAARRAVSELLRTFFAHLNAQLSAGTATIWAKVEARLPHKASDIKPGFEAAPGALQAPMQQQPVQQQQSKTTPDDE